MDSDDKASDDKLPLRWLAPETLTLLHNTNYAIHQKGGAIPKQSSVWTLGVTLWEVASLGHTPFASIYDHQFQSNSQLFELEVFAGNEGNYYNGLGSIAKKVF